MINNVPVNVKITPVESAPVSIPDKSLTTLAIDNLLDPIGGLVTGLAGVSGVWPGMSAILNSVPAKFSPHIEANASVEVAAHDVTTEAHLFLKHGAGARRPRARLALELFKVTIRIEDTINGNKDISFLVRGNLEHDLKLISKVYGNLYRLNNEDQLVVDAYVLERGFRLTYDSPASFQQQAEAVVQSIQAFLLCRHSIKTLINDLKADSVIVAILSNTTDRSLPPDELQPDTDTNAIYRSVVMLPTQTVFV